MKRINNNSDQINFIGSWFLTNHKLSDRLIVMYEGKVITEIETELATVENIGLAMAGINE